MVKPQPPAKSFKGNKQSLPSKPCVACGRDMTWRKSWAKNWDAVKYCSDACRKSKPALSTAVPAAGPIAKTTTKPSGRIQHG